MDELTIYRNERIEDYKMDLEDDKKSLKEAEDQLQEAIAWKYKMMGNVVKSYEKLQKLISEEIK